MTGSRDRGEMFHPVPFGFTEQNPLHLTVLLALPLTPTVPRSPHSPFQSYNYLLHLLKLTRFLRPQICHGPQTLSRSSCWSSVLLPVFRGTWAPGPHRGGVQRLLFSLRPSVDTLTPGPLAFRLRWKGPPPAPACVLGYLGFLR